MVAPALVAEAAGATKHTGDSEMDDNTERAPFGMPKADWTHIMRVLQRAIRLFLEDSGILPNDAYKARMIDFMWDHALGNLDIAGLRATMETMPSEIQELWRDSLTLWMQISRDFVAGALADLQAQQAGSGTILFDPDNEDTQVYYILSKLIAAYVPLRPPLQATARETTDASSAAASGLELLTNRQREVAGLLAEGLRRPEIAKKLMISPGTVKTHMEAIGDALGLDTTDQTVLADEIRRRLEKSGGG